MIKIKFRAWAIASRVMFYPDADDGWEITNGKIIPLPNTVLMQYTGLEDKNGKEIYEGDILECESNNNPIIICLVKYCQENGQYSTIRYSRGRRAGKCHPFGFSDSNPWYSAKQKIIGNIHENPELLI